MGLAENLSSIKQRIAAACERAKRDPSSVTLMAVTKTHPPETVQAAADLGLTFFGENKVQEAKAKIPLCSGKLRWHFIGHLQSNKCRDAVSLFSMIQSVDSWDLAEELNAKADQAARSIPILLEVNLAGEATKFGYPPQAVLNDLARINALPRLELHGRREAEIVVDQMLVHVVRENEHVGIIHQHRRKRFQLRARVRSARRIGRRIQQEPFGVRRDRLQRWPTQARDARRGRHRVAGVCPAARSNDPRHAPWGL